MRSITVLYVSITVCCDCSQLVIPKNQRTREWKRTYELCHNCRSSIAVNNTYVQYYVNIKWPKDNRRQQNPVQTWERFPHNPPSRNTSRSNQLPDAFIFPTSEHATSVRLSQAASADSYETAAIPLNSTCIHRKTRRFYGWRCLRCGTLKADNTWWNGMEHTRVWSFHGAERQRC